MTLSEQDLPIGVFDSGVGGLTVLHALTQVLPEENFLYLGDTARLPYGTKSPATVRAYACQAAGMLVERGIKALVVACNTASAFALPQLAELFQDIPVFGVVEPGADAAAAAASEVSNSGVLILATESTITGGAYQRALLRRIPQVPVFGRSCPLWVTLAEMATRRPSLVNEILSNDLRGFTAPTAFKHLTLLLGCTHFPVFKQAIEDIYLDTDVTVHLVDSATTTAATVAAALAEANQLRKSASPGSHHFLATDDVSRFSKVGRQFLAASPALSAVELVDLRTTKHNG